MNTKFKFGVEYSFVAKEGDNDWHHPVVDAAVSKLKRLGFKYAHRDGGALEVPSPPMTSLSEHKKWVTKLFAHVEKLGLVARRVDIDSNGDEVYHGTGGGHIHIELPQKSDFHRAAYMYRMIQFIAARPYLNWIFNEFMDDHNANHIGGQPNVRSLLESGTVSVPLTGKAPTWEQAILNNVWLEGKDYAIAFHSSAELSRYSPRRRTRTRYRTTELRFFDAPRTVKMAMEHIAVAKAIHERVLRMVEGTHGNSPSFCARDADAARVASVGRDKDLVRQHFVSFCLDHGLSLTKYEPYLQNYYDRLQYGSLT